MKTIFVIGSKKHTLKYTRKMPEGEVKKMKSLKRKKKDMDNSLNVLMNDMMSQMKVNESDRNFVTQNNQT